MKVTVLIFSKIDGSIGVLGKSKSQRDEARLNNQFLGGIFSKDIAKPYKDAIPIIDAYNKKIIDGIEINEGYYRSIAKQDKGLSDYLRTTKGSSVSMDAYSKSLNVSKASTIGLSIATTALNMAMTMCIALLVQGLIIGISKLITTEKEAAEAMQHAQQEYEDVKNEIANVQSELKTTSNRMDELNAKDKLSLVEDGELDTLKNTNNELETRLSLLKKEESIKKSTANDKAVKQAKKENDFLDGYGMTNPFSGKDLARAGKAVINPEYWFGQYKFQTHLQEYGQKADEYTTKRDNAKSDADFQKFDAKLNDYKKKIVDKRKELQKLADSITSSDSISQAEKQKLQSQIDFADTYLFTAKEINGMKIKNVLDDKQFSTTKDELVSLASQGKLTAETLNDPKYKAIVKAMNDITGSTGQTVTEFQALAKASNDVNAVDTKSSLFSQLENISTATSNLKEIGTAFKDVSDNGVVASSTMQKLQTELKATDEQLSNLQKAYSSGNKEEVKTQLTDIANAYIQNIDNLSTLTDEEKKQLTLELNSIGVKNSLALVEDAVTLAKVRGQIASTDFTTATSGEIDKLIDLANKAGIAGSAIELLAKKQKAASDQEALLKRVNGGELWTKSNVDEYIKLNKILSEPIDTSKILSGTKSVKVDWNKIVNGDGGKKEAKSATDKLKDEFTQAYEHLQYLEKEKIITTAQYLDRVYALNDKYNKNNAELWEKTDLEIFEYKKKLVEDQEKLYEEQQDKLKDQFKNEGEAYKRVIDKKIDALNKEEEANDKYYDNKIEKLKEDEKVLSDNNEEQEKSIKLEKDRQALEKANSQKTVNIYREGKGFVYEADQEKISEAIENYDATKKDLDNFKAKKAIEDQIKELEKAKKASEESIASQIEDWENLKTTVEDQLFQLGDSLDEHNSLVTLMADSVKLEYGEMTTAVANYVDSYISKMEELKAFQDKMKFSAPTGSSSGSSKGGGGGSSSNKPQNPKSSPSKGQTVTVKNSATNFANGVHMAGFVSGGSFQVLQVSGSRILIGRNGVATGWVNLKDIEGYEKGTLSASGGLSMVGERGRELRVLKQGTGIIPNPLTEKIMSMAQNPADFILKSLKPKIDFNNIIPNHDKTPVSLQFSGNLSFPNVKNGNDAEILIHELSNLSQDALQRAYKNP